MHGVDDLGVVDALQIGRRDAEIGVAQLALDDVERNARAGHLDRMSVTQLVRGEALAHAGFCGESPQLTAGGAGGPRPAC